MKRTYQDGGEERLEALKDAEDYRSQLFEDYVERMLRHRKDGSSYPLEDIRRWLAWLAGFLKDSGQALFYVEDITIKKLLIFQKNRINQLLRNAIRIIGLIIGSGIQSYLICGIMYKFGYRSIFRIGFKEL